MSDKTRLLFTANTLAVTGLIFLSLSSSYLSISTYTISLSGISNYVSFEDVKGPAFSSFSNFESFACRKSRNEEILTVCGNIFDLELSALVLKVSAVLTILLNLVVIYSVLHKKLFYFLPLSSAVVYFVGSFVYIAMNSGSVLGPEDEEVSIVYESGIFLLFMCNLLQILICFYFYYYSKVESLRFSELVESLAQSEMPFGQKDEKKLSDDDPKIFNFKSFVCEILSQSISTLESVNHNSNQDKSEKIAESLKLQISLFNKLYGEYNENKVADEIEMTKRYPSQLSLGKSQDAMSAATGLDRLVNENPESKFEMSRFTSRTESILEENEKQKMILEKNKQVLAEKQVKIEEIEKSKKLIEAREQSLIDQISEKNKYLKDYEDLLIQLKKEKDEAIKALNKKDQELGLVSKQLSIAKSEVAEFKGEKNLSNPTEKSTENIPTENFSMQIGNLMDSVQGLTQEKKYLQEKLSDLQKANESLDDKLKNCIQEYKQSLEKIYELEGKLREENLKKNESGEKSLRKALRKIERLTEKVRNSEEKENQAYQKLQQAEEEFERIKQELVHSSAQQTREIEILQARLKSQENFFEKELKKAQLSLESAKDEAKKQEIQCEFFKSELEKFSDIEKKLENSLPENLKSLKDSFAENSSKNFESLSMQIDLILQEKEKLRKKLQKTESELQIISEECQNLHKLKFESKKDSTVSLGSIESSSKSIQDSLIIEGISPSIVFHNPLIEKLSQLRKEPAMVYSSVWKNLEQMVQEKLKRDKKDIELGKDPQNVADFMFEFLQTQYGLKSLGLKQLKALIVSLEELYRIEHPYATFFCRVLGIFHPRPIPSKVAVGLFAALVQFNSICKKQSIKSENFAEVYEIVQFGGESSVGNVISLVRRIFKEHRLAGERILNSLHAMQPDALELKLLRVCSQLRSAGFSDDSLFPKDVLDYSEFVDNLRITLDVWVSQAEAELLCQILDESNTGEVHKSYWKSKINFEDFCNKLETKPAMVTKADFLNSLITEHEYEVLEDYHILRSIIPKGNPITAELASYYLLQIDANLSINIQERLFKEALVHDGGQGKEVSSEALSIVILKHNIGGYGKGLFFLNTLST